MNRFSSLLKQNQPAGTLPPVAGASALPGRSDQSDQTDKSDELPPGGTAMFSFPLWGEECGYRSSVICYTPEGLLSDAPATQRLAEAEGLWAHALSAALRRRVLEQGEDAVSAESLAAADLTKVAWPGDAVATVAEGVDLAAAAGGAVGAVVEEA